MTTSPSAVLNAVPPRFLTSPLAVSTAGTEAVELAASAGLVLDPWQVDVLDVALAEREDGKWAAREVALICPRQNGKGSVLTAIELAGLFLFGEQLILHSAHEFKTATEAFLRIWHHIESTPDLDRLVYRKLQNNNDMSIELLSGQRLRFLARTGGSGRGFSGDRIILDEAFNLPDKAISALAFTMAARPNPQVVYTSMAPLADVNSTVLRRLCKRGREGSKAFAYIEYAADADADLDDPDAWAEANPGYPFRIGDEDIEFERGVSLPEDFARERLGIWHDEADARFLVIPETLWLSCERIGHKPTGTLRYALDVDQNTKGETWASVACSDGTHVELVTLPSASGTSWVAPACKAKKDTIGELLVAADGPASALIDELEAAGVKVRKVKASEFVQASMQFLDAVMQGTLRHIDQPTLNTAAGGVVRRDVGDGQWRWSRNLSTVDIAPLCAATLARWAASLPSDTEGGWMVSLP